MIATLIWPVIVLLVAAGIEIRRRRGRLRLRRLGGERRAYRALVDAATRAHV